MFGFPVKYSPMEYEHSRGGYGGEHSQVGHFTADLFSSPSSKPDKVQCPYCHESMKRMEGRINRVVWVHPSTQIPRPMIVQKVPSTHTVLTCRQCEQVFTMPKRSNASDRQGRGAAQ